VLKRAVDMKRTNPDNAIRVIDMGIISSAFPSFTAERWGGGAAAGVKRGAEATRRSVPPVILRIPCVCHVKGLPVARLISWL